MTYSWSLDELMYTDPAIRRITNAAHTGTIEQRLQIAAKPPRMPFVAGVISSWRERK
jgi:hypothetical protein